jgi:hypothetical protein
MGGIHGSSLPFTFSSWKKEPREEWFKYDRYIGDMLGKGNGLQKRKEDYIFKWILDIRVMSCEKST